MSSTSIFRIAAIAAVIASGIVVGGHASAVEKPTEAERHCVVEVTGVEDGVYVTQPEVCFGSQAEAVLHAVLISTDTWESGGFLLSSGNNTIGTHYTSTSYSGSSVRVVGTTCGGGVWYPTGAWNNNIESSRHHCGTSPTTFYDSSACAGSSHPIYSAATSLSQMNNKASCVRYG
ncbi:MAG: hypothetical protein F4Z58_03925 [Acidimicrobiaceae bacterium]|nr:hypothetical protein [Acidimicrobiaceae bacterium]MXW75176.1 hypothetical protein [Acidimicrobiaceae bacterium]MYD06257.1 hypothetical protein [Acidimicrobiaceae bacterium]MYI59354.1 hypothetical protein [Acidimicrobiaceae bacterium]